MNPIVGDKCDHLDGAYYNAEQDNFYCKMCHRGMGNEFYKSNIKYVPEDPLLSHGKIFPTGRVWWLSVPKRGLALGFTEKERVVHWDKDNDEIVKVREEKE